MGWSYYPDGKLASRSDEGVPVGKDVVLVDNSDTQNASKSGTWPLASSGSDHQGFNYRTHAAGSTSDSFTWDLHIPSDGSYEVFVKYEAATATDAAYTVAHASGSANRTVDQSANAGEWVSLGSFSFEEANGSQSVSLAANASGSVVADAVKLVRDNSGQADDESKDFGYSYDPNGNLTSIVDSSPGAEVDEFVMSYTGLNQVAEVEEMVAGSVEATTSYAYDANGNPLSRSHDDQVSDYEYDVRDLVDLVSVAESGSDPDPKVTTFSYTPRGQRAAQTKDNGNTVDYSYFGDGLLKHKVEKKSGGAVVAEHTIAYTPNGHRASDTVKKMDADNHSAYLNFVREYDYDPRDRVTAVTKRATGGSVLESESYAYDPNGNVVDQTVDGTSTQFQYDRNRLQSATVGGVAASYNYDPFGRLDTVTSAGEVVERYDYDGFDRVASHEQLQGDGSTESTTYDYDPLDRTTSRTKAAGTGSAETKEFTYLGMTGQVLSESVSGEVQKSYQYSPWGERLSQVKFNTDGSSEDSFPPGTTRTPTSRR
jgi:YD repeat-containing protein